MQLLSWRHSGTAARPPTFALKLQAAGAVQLVVVQRKPCTLKGRDDQGVRSHAQHSGCILWILIKTTSSRRGVGSGYTFVLSQTG